MTIRIITDSVADIPKKIADDLNIKVLPLTVNFENESYKDGIEINSEEFFDKLSQVDKLPSTSQVSPGEFIKEFELAINSGDKVIAILMSAQLSGTYASAVTAKEFLETNDIAIIDSKSVTLAQGLIAIEAARMAKDGAEFDEIVDRALYMRDNMVYKFIVDDLKYLQLGGRLSLSQAVVGKLLNIKPIITMEDGRLKLEHKIRGRKKAIKWVINWIKENNMDLETKTVGVFHSNAPEYVQELLNAMEDNFTIKEVIMGKVGAVVGTHAGPGCIAVAFVK